MQNELNEKQLGLIKGLAWKTHLQTGVDFEELFSEGCLGCCVESHRYKDQSPAKFTSYIYHAAYTFMIDYVQQQLKWRNSCDGYEAVATSEFIAPEYFQDPAMKEDVRYVFELAIEFDEGMDKDYTAKEMRGMIVKWLFTAGWTNPRVWDAIRNAKSYLNQSPIGSIIL